MLSTQSRQLILGEAGCKHYDIRLAPSEALHTDNRTPGSDISLSYCVLKPAMDTTCFSPCFDWNLIQQCGSLIGKHDTNAAGQEETYTPAQAKAYARWEQARTAFVGKHFAEALSILEGAISGNQDSPGFATDWRFHRLAGIIRLGFLGCDIELIELEKAGHYMMTAAELALPDNSLEAAVSYLAAGWAAYSRTELTEALFCTEQAIALHPGWSAALYQMSKILISAGNVKDAFTYLGLAIDIEAFYALKACADLDFQKYTQALLSYLKALREEKFLKHKTQISADLNKMKELNVPLSLERILAEFMQEKPLIDLMIAERDWKLFKIKPWFYTNDLGEIQIEIESTTTIMETYQEKVIVKPASWLHKEQIRLVPKNRLVEKPKVNRYPVKAVQDTITFFTGRIMADFRLVVVEGGAYKMGDINDIGRIDEKPVRTVSIKSFLISSLVVTQKLWNLVMNYIPSSFTGYDIPVEQVSWYECLEFCNKLSDFAGFSHYYGIEKSITDTTNKSKIDTLGWTVTRNPLATGYRLPTEAEWEYAARGGINTGYFTFAGSDDENTVAWHKNNSQYKTQSVGSKQPNELGIYDMSGNVWEWCWDWYDTYNPEALENPSGAEKGSYRVIRGGSWADNKNYLRSASRGSENPGGKYNSIGFRIARNIP